jgi:hypothetical protein
MLHGLGHPAKDYRYVHLNTDGKVVVFVVVNQESSTGSEGDSLLWSRRARLVTTLWAYEWYCP